MPPILRNEGSVLTVSAYLQGEYGQADVNVGVPCVIGREGVRRVIELDLTKDEQEQFAKSCQFLRDVRKEI